MRKQTQWYVAGLLDGEGYVSILRCKKGNKSQWSPSRSVRYLPVVKIALTDEPMIQWLKDSFGGSKEYRIGIDNHKDSWCWSIRGKKAINFIKEVHQSLRIKHQQAQLLLRFPLPEGKQTLTDERFAQQEKLYHRARELNHRGRGSYSRDAA